jgi:hypothetical protein
VGGMPQQQLARATAAILREARAGQRRIEIP